MLMVLRDPLRLMLGPHGDPDIERFVTQRIAVCVISTDTYTEVLQSRFFQFLDQLKVNVLATVTKALRSRDRIIIVKDSYVLKCISM